MKRRTFLAGLWAIGAARFAHGKKGPAATMYSQPFCSCCKDYAAYLRGHGYQVKEVTTLNLDGIRRKHRVPEQLYGCHTMLIGRYVVEGHVPVSIIGRLLREQPNIVGIALAGMPEGSPGMTGTKTEVFRIYQIGMNASDPPQVYAVE